MKRWITKMVVAVACALGAGGASAQQCADFSDVLASSGSCAAVEWMKNRVITTGCVTPPGQPPGSYYCPLVDVTRSAMALFMHRLGKVLTPEVMKDHVTLLGATTIPGEPPAPEAASRPFRGDRRDQLPNPGGERGGASHHPVGESREELSPIGLIAEEMHD